MSLILNNYCGQRGDKTRFLLEIGRFLTAGVYVCLSKKTWVFRNFRFMFLASSYHFVWNKTLLFQVWVSDAKKSLPWDRRHTCVNLRKETIAFYSTHPSDLGSVKSSLNWYMYSPFLYISIFYLLFILFFVPFQHWVLFVISSCRDRKLPTLVTASSW